MRTTLLLCADTLHNIVLNPPSGLYFNMPMDTISLRNFHMTAVLGLDAWNRPSKSQPIVLTLKLLIDTTSAGSSDEIAHTFSYGQMCKDVAVLSGDHFSGVDHLTARLVAITISRDWPGERLQISLVAPKALLRAEGGLGQEVTLRKRLVGAQPTWNREGQVWLIKQLKVACIIGVNPHERLEKQQVTINLELLGEHDIESRYEAQDGRSRGLWATIVSRLCSVSCAGHSQCLYFSRCRLFTRMSRLSNNLSSRHWKRSPPR